VVLKFPFLKVLTPVVGTYIFSSPSFVTLVSFFQAQFPRSQCFLDCQERIFPSRSVFQAAQTGKLPWTWKAPSLLETYQLRIAFRVVTFVYCERIMVICFFLKLDCSNKVVPRSCIHLVRVQADMLTTWERIFLSEFTSSPKDNNRTSQIPSL